MEQFYKDHRIEFSAWWEADGWLVDLFVYYHDGPTNVLVTVAINEKFTSYEEAIDAGFARARKWIDDGKPAAGRI